MCINIGMTENELLELLAGVVKLATPNNSNSVNITSLDTPIVDSGLDSLDVIMVSIYLSDVYGVPEEIAKTMSVETVRQMFEFMEANKTKEPTSVESALNDISS